MQRNKFRDSRPGPTFSPGPRLPEYTGGGQKRRRGNVRFYLREKREGVINGWDGGALSWRGCWPRGRKDVV